MLDQLNTALTELGRAQPQIVQKLFSDWVGRQVGKVKNIHLCQTVTVNSQLKHANYNVGNSSMAQIILTFNPEVKVTKSIQEITLFEVINNIGSSMGLWVGISVFSIFKSIRRFWSLGPLNESKVNPCIKFSFIGFATCTGILFFTFLGLIIIYSQTQQIS